MMSPGTALGIVNDALDESKRGEEVDEAMDVLYDLAEKALNEKESL